MSVSLQTRAVTGGVAGALALHAAAVVAVLTHKPVQVPTLLGAVKATEAALAGEPLAAVAPWLQLLVAGDVVYLVAGLLTFDAILES